MSDLQIFTVADDNPELTAGFWGHQSAISIATMVRLLPVPFSR
jgi:hypothetical protein